MREWVRAWTSTDITADCAQVTAPTLVVTGEPGLDRVVPVASTLELLDLIPHARHAVLPGTGHVGIITKPREFASLMSETPPLPKRLRESLPTPMPMRLDFDGPAGRLEGLLDEPKAPPRAAVVFAHPHPPDGGTMHTKAVFQGAKGLTRIGCAVLRFNFRGVGASAGTFDEGPGEMEDFAAALDLMHQRYPGAPLWAAGFSFGSWIALETGAKDDRVSAAHRHRATGQARAATTGRTRSRRPSRSSSSRATWTSSARSRTCGRSTPAPGAEGAGRDRRRDASLRRQDRGSRRGARVAARGLRMTDAVIVAAVRTPIGKAPNGALRDDAAGRAGGDRPPGRARARARRSIPPRSTTS